MLSMLEKIKANAANLSKPQLGEAPLNLSAMLDNGHGKLNGSEGSSGNSGEIRNFWKTSCFNPAFQPFPAKSALKVINCVMI